MSEPLRIFVGFDPRQAVSYNVLQQSIIQKSSKPVSITPLVLEQLPIERQGLTPFTFTRFLVPWLCDYKGWALFLDADMLLTDDISKIFEFRDDSKQVMVIKNKKQFEWASVMLFNCEKCQVLSPEYIETADRLHCLDWADEVGDLPRHWNHLVGYDMPTNEVSLIHYTQGVPAYPETQTSEHANLWRKEYKDMNSTIPWVDLMGRSVHAAKVGDKIVPKYHVEPPCA